MATYGNTGGNGLNINVYSGSGGNLSEWALDYDGMKLLTTPEVITISNITTNQAVTVTLKAKPIFTNITVSFFRVKFPDGTIAEYPATNNIAVFTTTVTAPLGSQQSLLVYARDNSGNRSAVAQHQYTIINSNPPSTNTITHNIPSNFNAGDVKQIQISGAVDPEGDAYTYTLILPEEISGSKISGIANNETVTLTVQNTIQYTRTDKIIIRVTDINGAQNDKVLDITMLFGGSSGGTNSFNVRTSFPSSVYQNEVFAAKIWELGGNNYTYGLNLPNGITSSKTTGILSNENFTITIAPSVIPNSTVSIDVVVYTGSVSVGSFVVNMLVDGVTGEMSYTTPGTYEFTVPNSVNSVSMLQVYSDKVISGGTINSRFSVDNLKEENLIRKNIPANDWEFSKYNQQVNNILYHAKGTDKVSYTINNFDTIQSTTLPSLGSDPGSTIPSFEITSSVYGNGSYLIAGIFNGVTRAYLSTNNFSTFTIVNSVSYPNASNRIIDMIYYNSTFYILIDTTRGIKILVSIDGGYNFIEKSVPIGNNGLGRQLVSNRNWFVNEEGVSILIDEYSVKLFQSKNKCNSWTEINYVASNITLGEGYDIVLKNINNKVFIIKGHYGSVEHPLWVSNINYTSWRYSKISGTVAAHKPIQEIGRYIYYFNNKYWITDVGGRFVMYDNDLNYVAYSDIKTPRVNNDVFNNNLDINNNYMVLVSDVIFGHSVTGLIDPMTENPIHKRIYLSIGTYDLLSLDSSINDFSSPSQFFNANNEIVCITKRIGSGPWNVTRIKLTSEVENPTLIDGSNIITKDPNIGHSLVNPKQSGNFGKNGYAKYLNNIEVTPGEKININVTAPDGGVRLVWGTNRYFPTNAG